MDRSRRRMPMWKGNTSEGIEIQVPGGLDELDIKSLLGGGGDLTPDFREPSYLETVDNRIYFYGEVDTHRILQLNKKVRDLDIGIHMDNMKYSVETSPHIYIHLNSPGGSVFAALAGMDELRRVKTPLTTIVDGFCGSAATFLSLIGDRRRINKNAYMMLHQLSSEFYGTYNQLKDQEANMDMLMTKMMEIYKEYTKLPEAKLKKIMDTDIWFTAQECLDYGLVDEILG